MNKSSSLRVPMEGTYRPSWVVVRGNNVFPVVHLSLSPALSTPPVLRHSSAYIKSHGNGARLCTRRAARCSRRVDASEPAAGSTGEVSHLLLHKIQNLFQSIHRPARSLSLSLSLSLSFSLGYPPARAILVPSSLLETPTRRGREV